MKTPWQYAETGNEFSHQAALFQWAAMAEMFGVAVADMPKSYFEKGHAKAAYDGAKRQGYQVSNDANKWLPLTQLRWLHAIKNQGHGDAIRGARSAAEGVKPGVFDIFLPVPMRKPEATVRNGHYFTDYFCGLYIELKRPDGKGKVAGRPSNEQLNFFGYAREAGYQAEFAYGWLEARDCLLRYLGHSA